MEFPNNHIILLNGTSSAGKSTICKALLPKMKTPFWHFSSDHFIESGMHPKTRFDNDEFDWTEHRPLFFDAFHRSIAAFSESGIDLIVEHIIEQPEWAHQLASLLSGSDVFVVSLRCPVSELIRRERARGDRNIGEAEYHIKTYQHAPADVEIDATNSADENSEIILSAWNNRIKPGSFPALWKPA